MSLASAAFLSAFDALPEGGFDGLFAGKHYGVTKSGFADGRSQKLVAHEHGGRGYISLNVYRLSSGARLYPCEMPLEKVVEFVLAVRVVNVD